MNQSFSKSLKAAYALHHDGRLDEARDAYVAYLDKNPSSVIGWTNLGSLFRKQKNFVASLRAQERAAALAPDDENVLNNYANILTDLCEYERAIELRKRLLKSRPDLTMNYALIVKCLSGLGRMDEVTETIEPLLGTSVVDPEINLHLAFAYMSHRQYHKGFSYYKSRWDCADLTPRTLSIPELDPNDSVDGLSIVVAPEQGFGDAIQMLRFVEPLSHAGASVHVVVTKPILRLVQNLPGAASVGVRLSELRTHDRWINLLDLPLTHFKSDDITDVPPPTRLTVPEDSRTRARQITAPYKDKYKVGVVWAGSQTFKGDAQRSFTHREYLPLTDIPGVQVFSLYKGPAIDAFHADGSHAFMVDAGSSDRDFADCAAMMEEMDIVITSDTATAHVAGSLGIDVWTILQWDAFWTYGKTGEKTDWYPSMRLFRQKEPSDWTAPLKEVEQELRNRVSEKL